MVNGLEIFRQHFRNCTNDYVLIGGVACELALNSVGLEFRPTDDFDIVIVSENLADGFGVRLKDFIRDGDYSVKRRESNGQATFFCFLAPKNNDFPSKLELATDKPSEDWPGSFAPLDIGDGHPSLSAILFDQDFYHFILDNTHVVEGISTIRLEGLIPLKCHAYLELSKRENPSPKILANIEKHRTDVFRLADALPDGEFSISGKIATAVQEMLEKIEASDLSEEQRDLADVIRKFYNL